MPRRVYPRTPTPQRFFTKIAFTDTCWLWRGCRGRGNYGLFWNGARMVPAHRWAYEFFVGLIGQGLTIDHLCRVHDCVQPDHLEAVTLRENLMRGNTPAATNAQKTACLRGHPFTSDNTYRYSDGRRRCRTCDRDWMRQYRARK